MSLSSICSPRQKQDLCTLGLTPDKFGKLPDADTIKKAYRTKVIQVHPDKQQQQQQQVSSPTSTSDAATSKKINAAAAFLAVQEAYENLTSPQKLKEEKLMNQSAAANQQFRAKSPTASSRGSGLFGGTSSNQSQQRTRTPPTSSRPAFSSTKSPSSKFATASSSASFQSSSPFHQSNLGSTTHNSSSTTASTRRQSSGSFSSATSPLSSSTSRLSNSATRGVYFNRAPPPPSTTSTSSSGSSQQRRRSSMMDTGNKYSTTASSSPFSPRSAAPSSNTTTSGSSSSTSSSNTNTFVVNSKTPNYQPGTALFPPPFKNNNLMIKAPFPSFLPNGETYIFETDPSAFGIYSNHLRHGDTARISISSSSSTGQPDDEGLLFFEGVIIGVAADGNLYWWRLLSSNSHQPNEKELDAFATFAGPTIPANSFQQANRLVVVKQPVPMMDPLSFSNNNKDTYSSVAPSTSTTTKSTPQHHYGSNHQNQQHQYASSSGASTPSSLGSSLNGTTATSSSFCDGNITVLLRDVVENEKTERERKMMIYAMWVGEQLWCWNMMFVALADSARFSRTL